MATMSILGMYQFDGTLFDNMTSFLPTPAKVPTMYPTVNPLPIDPSVLYDNLLSELAEFEVCYTDFDFLKWMIGRWAAKEQDKWQRQYNTLWYDYNPIWNKDGIVTHTETRKSDGTENRKGEKIDNYTKTRNVDNTQVETRNYNDNSTSTETGSTTVSNNENVQHHVAAFNTPQLQQDWAQENNNGGDTNVNRTVNYEGTDSGTGNVKTDYNETENNNGSGSENWSTNRNGNDRIEYTDKEQGNIGVTTTQQMIDAERSIVLYNIYDIIIKDFKQRFCLLVY